MRGVPAILWINISILSPLYARDLGLASPLSAWRHCWAYLKIWEVGGRGDVPHLRQVSLTPGFSRVSGTPEGRNRFSGLRDNSNR